VKLFALVLTVTLVAAGTAQAHHSAAAAYDATQSIDIIGIVTSFTWTNPHSHLYVNVTAGPFKDKQYVIELSSPVVLKEAGWSRAEFKAGDRVTIRVFPSRVGAAIGLCRGCVVRVNGVTKPLTVE
jgi:predicted amidohydrolase